MFSEEYNYCPKCRDEYMPQASRCAACDIELVSGGLMLAREKEEMQEINDRAGVFKEGDELVIVQRAPLKELKNIQQLLEKQRIASLITGDENSCGKGCCPSMHFLSVRQEDAYAAAGIMEDEFRRLTFLADHDTAHADRVFNPESDDAVCPACGNVFSTSQDVCPDCGLCFG
ncbi:MAG: hypothetical protein KKE17_15075 [Proteobacteria bacterium]|nr:hypothetical protein [Pseudomonadota bacterium]MBU1711321.1 hypothetical protein [Pseudomonadota bacterium]